MYKDGEGTEKDFSREEKLKQLTEEISGGLAGVVKYEYNLARKYWLGDLGENNLQYKYAALNTIVKMYEAGEGFRKNNQKAKEFRAEAEKYHKYYQGCFITTAVCDSLGKPDNC